MLGTPVLRKEHMKRKPRDSNNVMAEDSSLLQCDTVFVSE